ncbi:hypothetical protein [Spirosoma spitsbergense]|uniref:hypothetical protein n=1 Tax=Spirosoma spitsbergense TaxID=431554 RepID=UPI000379951E|nr:hypothetical protein [Spirosoma spitsbergense]
MTEREIALNALAVGRLVFVDTIAFPANGPLVSVELSPILVSILPADYHALQLRRESFNVASVITRYERYVVTLERHGYEEATAVAEEMLRTAKIQAAKL